MSTKTGCQSENCPTVGVEAVPLERFVDIDTDDGDRIVYDTERENAWIQSDLYYPRRLCV